MRKIFVLIAGLVFISVLLFYTYPKSLYTFKDPLKVEIIAGLKHTDWLKRDEAVSKILSQKSLLKDNKIADALIELLNREIAEEKIRIPDRADVIDPMAEKYGEAFGEYFINILDAVSSIDDKRVIPVLADSVEYGFGVWESLARFGDDAVDPLIEKYHSTKNELQRRGCVSVLELLIQQKIRNESREKIKNLLSEALKDESESARHATEKTLKREKK